uniref:RNA polymerase beta' subunit n=1 Tax=Schizaea pusilla TaxID=148579 RepID=UPI00211DFEBF|nr:RNA polymerase beta' subunit [Schizaea pusilla]UTV01459.1 RNA polymerase beta' subunit [Schizaea pusilla]
MIHQNGYQQLRIELASPEQIRGWAERELPNGAIVGRVDRPYTLHYKTHKPERDGPFRERISGPTRSGVCACGNYRSMDNEEEYSDFREHCEVEFADSRVRRYRMGYIESACPVTHVWFLKRIPSYIANLLAQPLKESESLVHCDLYLARPMGEKPTLSRLRGSSNHEDWPWENILPVYFSNRNFAILQKREVATGGDAAKKRLASLNPQNLLDYAYSEWGVLIKQGSTETKSDDCTIQRRKDLSVRRMKLARDFLQTDMKPEWMVPDFSPVLPPELRPIVEPYEGESITSDPNEPYRKVIHRNNTLIESSAGSGFTPEGLIACQKRLVQEAVDALIDNSIRGQPMKGVSNRPYKSFSEVIEGKEGRFRGNLLGKRVDYSGRFVIVVGPSLLLHQCGLPRELSIELFQAFVIRDPIGRHLARNLRAARNTIRRKEPIIWKVLRGVMQGHPILLNRAPTLHRSGIQAFQPILMQGRAIRLHPLVCGGFNADFDGDQMAVHVPLSLEAQTEARSPMFSHTNPLSPATGDPVPVPTQDMLLGIYALTIGNTKGIFEERCPSAGGSHSHFKIPCFASHDDVLRAKQLERIDSHSFLWLRWNTKPYSIGPKTREVIIESQYESSGTSFHFYGGCHVRRCSEGSTLSTHILTTAGRTLFNQQMREAMQGISESLLCRNGSANNI